MWRCPIIFQIIDLNNFSFALTRWCFITLTSICVHLINFQKTNNKYLTDYHQRHQFGSLVF